MSLSELWSTISRKQGFLQRWFQSGLWCKAASSLLFITAAETLAAVCTDRERTHARAHTCCCSWTNVLPLRRRPGGVLDRFSVNRDLVLLNWNHQQTKGKRILCITSSFTAMKPRVDFYWLLVPTGVWFGSAVFYCVSAVLHKAEGSVSALWRKWRCAESQSALANEPLWRN